MRDIFPNDLLKVIIDYVGEPQRLHMWAASIIHGDSWKWIIKFLPAPGTLNFYQLFRDEHAEITQQIGYPYPKVINSLIEGKYAVNIYREFYDLDKAPKFYSRVAYAMLRTSPEVFSTCTHPTCRISISGLFGGLSDTNLELYNRRAHSRPRVHLRMIQCLIFACEKHEITFADIDYYIDESLIENILGIGAINNKGIYWYERCFELLAVPLTWYPHRQARYHQYAAHFPHNRTLKAIVNRRWPNRGSAIF